MNLNGQNRRAILNYLYICRPLHTFLDATDRRYFTESSVRSKLPSKSVFLLERLHFGFNDRHSRVEFILFVVIDTNSVVDRREDYGPTLPNQAAG